MNLKIFYLKLKLLMLKKYLLVFLSLFCLLSKLASGCGIATFNINREYACNSTDKDVFGVSAFPSDFSYAKVLVIGMWFRHHMDFNKFPVKENGNQDNTIMVFKLTSENTTDDDRRPACYYVKESARFVCVIKTSNSNPRNKTGPTDPPLSLDAWYFLLSDVNLNEGTANVSVLDASQMNTPDESSLVRVKLEWNGISFGENYYASSKFQLFFGNDGYTHIQSCTSIWQPFMITGYTPKPEDVYPFAFGFTLISHKFAIKPYSVYQNMLDVEDRNLLSEIDQNLQALSWSANKQTYPFAVHPTEKIKPSLKFPISFFDSNKNLSFAVRITFKIEQGTDTCDVYWLMRRISATTSQTTFGIGISKTGYVTIKKGNSIAPDSSQSSQLIYTTFNTWMTLHVGCYEQFLLATICFFLKPAEPKNRYHLHFPIGDYVESMADTLWLGSSSPGSPTSSSSDCGLVTIVSPSINQGHIPLPLNALGLGCYGGCEIEFPDNNCYVLDHSAQTCPSQTVRIQKNCVPCPTGCSSCIIENGNARVTICTACLQNYTLSTSTSTFTTNSSGICVCTGDYYFTVDPNSGKGICQRKNQITTIIVQTGAVNFTYNMTFSSPFYSRESDLPTILPTITASLGNKSISLTTLNVNNSTQISFSFEWNANIDAGTSMILDFSVFNQIEGMAVQVAPSRVPYIYIAGYAILDSETLATIESVAQASKIGRLLQETGASMITIVLGGMSNAAIFLLDAPGELELYKYLNIYFPENFVAFYNFLYAGNISLIPNLFMHLNNGEETPTSTFHKFGYWKTPILLLERCGDGLSKQIVTLILIIFTWIPALIYKRKDKNPSFFLKLNYIFRWNLLISFFLGDFTFLILQTMLQFHEISFQNMDTFSILSITATFLILVTYALIFGIGAYQVNKKRLEIPFYMTSARKKLQKRIEKDKFPPSLAVFKDELNDDHFLDKNFLFVLKFQDFLNCLNYFFLQEAPLAQCYIFTLLSGFLMLVIVILRPFPSTLNFVAILFNETGKLLLGIIAIMIATTFQSGQYLSQDTTLIVGKVMISMVLAIFGGNLLIALYGLGVQLYQCISRKRKENRKKERKAQVGERSFIHYPAKSLESSEIID